MTSKDDGKQWDLDEELKYQEELRQCRARQDENFDNAAAGRGGDTPDNNNYESIEEREPLSSPPPSDKRKKVCLHEDPATRETIRRKLNELGVTNANQLIRSYTAAVLLEAISDYETAVEDGMRIKSPTGYFRSLLL